MAGDCKFRASKPWTDGDRRGPAAGAEPARRSSANFEAIDGVLYRKKLERGYVNYREVLSEERRDEAIRTFHRRRHSQRHLSLEETYKCVAENYWWDGMYFQIRTFVLDCPECKFQHSKKMQGFDGQRCVTKTVASHGADVLSKLRSQREAGLFCDITLRTSSRSFSAHRAVLAAVSDHFQEIFTELDASKAVDIDLTEFREDNLLSLLDFSYSSTLCVHQEDLHEVCAMARHLGMWPAVEACSALLKEQEKKPHAVWAGSCHGFRQQQRERLVEMDNGMNCLALDTSEDSFPGSPRRNLRSMPKSPGQNSFPVSPSHRMKLMDFKSPSSKKTCSPRHAISPSRSQSYSSISASKTRLLRSSPGAAKEVQRFLPMTESPRRSRKPHPVSQLSSTSRPRPGTSCSPVRVKQELEQLGEDEEDYARAQEKYKLMNVLGLQRTALLPRPEDLIGWRQKKRLRKLKANNYSLTKRRKPRSVAPTLTYEEMTLTLPLCNPVTTRLLKKPGKSKSLSSGSTEKVPAKKRRNAPQFIPPTDRSMRSKGVFPGLFPCSAGPGFIGRELRRSVRIGDCGHPRSQHHPRRGVGKTHARNKVKVKTEPAAYSISGLTLPSSAGDHTPKKGRPTSKKVKADGVKTLRYNNSRLAAKSKQRRSSVRQADKTKKGGGHSTSPKTKDGESNGFSEHTPPPSVYSHPLYKAIKEEPADPIPVGGPFIEPSSPDLGKRQSKPPIKLLDSGFLFSFCRPAGASVTALKKEEESVDICLMRSLSRVGPKFEGQESSSRTLRDRGPQLHPVAKQKERRGIQGPSQKPRHESHTVSLHPDRCSGSKATQSMPKRPNQVALSSSSSSSSRSCAMLESVRRSRLKRLRGPCSQAPKVPKATHSCLQCPAAYKDCDALIMHQLRHVDGKHWPCPLCSKTFFRLRNVRNHIRTHDPKLYKCRSCIAAGL